MLVIALRATPLESVALVLLPVALMHAFVYRLAFRGGSRIGPDTSAVSLFLRFTVVGYAIALLLSAASLWFFGRFEGIGFAAGLHATVVLGFPAAVGAAAARLIL